MLAVQVHTYGQGFIFLLFACACLVGATLLNLGMVETQNKSMSEIEGLLLLKPKATLETIFSPCSTIAHQRAIQDKLILEQQHLRAHPYFYHQNWLRQQSSPLLEEEASVQLHPT